MTIYLANAFSLSMLTQPGTLIVGMIESVDEVKQILARGFTSVIGHEATAKIVSLQIGVPVPVNRVSVQLVPGDILVVFQLLTRLPEGKILTEQEMKQVQARWYVVTVMRLGGE